MNYNTDVIYSKHGPRFNALAAKQVDSKPGDFISLYDCLSGRDGTDIVLASETEAFAYKGERALWSYPDQLECRNGFLTVTFKDFYTGRKRDIYKDSVRLLLPTEALRYCEHLSGMFGKRIDG